MSQRAERSGLQFGRARIRVFAALGSAARLRLLERLRPGEDRSVSVLTAGSRLSRQAVSKHLRILESAGIVRSIRCGRETLFRLELRNLSSARNYLDEISSQWDQALGRLKAFVEGRRRPHEPGAAGKD
jgi:DNA-binding transcriptional ArsR family regulator